MLRIAIAGDRFLTVNLIEDLLREHLMPIVGDISFSGLELDWPDDTPTENGELHEFVGDPQAIAAFVGDAQAIVTQVAPISRRMIEQAPNLEIIGCCRGGPVSVNVAAATEHGIPVLFSPGGNARAVAEFTLGLIMAETKGIARAHCALATGEWRPAIYHYASSARELFGRTIGLVGFGHIGQLLIPHLRAFEMRVLVYDPYVPADRCAALGVEKVDLPSLLAESDIVSLHARVTPETRGMMGAAQFATMKPGAYFINTARGPLVDYDALYAALASGHLGGAGLDTFAVEPPPPGWPLLKLPNVTLTPHIAGASQETARRKVASVAVDFANFYAGRPVQYCANPEVLARRR